MKHILFINKPTCVGNIAQNIFKDFINLFRERGREGEIEGEKINV